MNTVPPLSNIYLHLTEGCNLACRHCWLNPPFDPDGQHCACLPFDRIESLIAEAKPLGLRSLKLTGGEPLLHPRVIDILSLASRENLGIVLETNGLLINRPLVTALKQHGRVFVAVSLDSHRPDVHDAFRGVRGAFRRTTQGLRMLADAGLRPQVIATLFPGNREEIPELVRYMESLGAGSFKLNIMQPTRRGAAMHRQRDSLSLADILRICHDMAEHLAQSTSIPLFPDIPFAFRSLGSIHRGQGGRCSVKSILGVLSSGHYALCGIGTSVGDLVFGQVGKDSLHEVWETHPMLKRIRAEIPERLSGVCGQCLMKNICMGACIAQNYYRSGSLTAPHWFCSMAHEQGIFPPSRLMPLSPVSQGVTAGV